MTPVEGETPDVSSGSRSAAPSGNDTPGTGRTPPDTCLLDDRVESLGAADGLLVLDWLRQKPGHRGTKEGCREGDCGACTVLVGTLEGDRVRYRPVTSCLMPVGELAGKHLVTIEGLTPAGSEAASPVQRAVVEAGASQCGFCTPGIVVSLTGMLLDPPPVAADDLPAGCEPAAADPVVRALSGHLCRCTGYRSLRQAGARILEQRRAEWQEAEEAGESFSVGDGVHAGWLPSFFLDAETWLRAGASEARSSEIGGPEPQDAAAAAGSDTLIVAGGTDLYVQRGESLPRRPIVVLGQRSELRGIELVEEGGRPELRIGALTSFEDLGESELLRQRVPRLVDHLFWIASWQVRNRATVGGNLVNASPIGDITILMLALGAQAILAGPAGRRRLALEDLYLGYKQLAMEKDELLEELRLDWPWPRATDGSGADARVTFRKVSKRPCLDIATVNAAAQLCLRGGRIVDARLAAGGVAPVPLFLARTSQSLIGLELPKNGTDPESSLAFCRQLRQRLAVAADEIAPIDDVRGSAAYKRLLLRQLLVACMVDLLPEELSGDLATEDTLHGSP